MPAPSSPKTLYRIDECPDLMADGCIADENGNLVFLSIWARDTAVQEFLARLTLGREGSEAVSRHHRTGRERPGLRRQRREPGKAHHPRLPAHAVRFPVQRVAVRPPLRAARQGQRQRAGNSAT